MPLSRHSVGTYPETSSHATCQGTFGHSRLDSARWATVDWSWHSEHDLISTSRKKKRVQAGNEWSNILPKSSQARKKPSPPDIILNWTEPNTLKRQSSVSSTKKRNCSDSLSCGRLPTLSAVTKIQMKLAKTRFGLLIVTSLINHGSTNASTRAPWDKKWPRKTEQHFCYKITSLR